MDAVLNGYKKAVHASARIDITGEHLPDLFGPDFTLAPYERSLWPEDVLVRLWTMAKEEGTLHRIFWWQRDVPEPERTDLINFLNYFQHKLLLMVLDKTATQILGFVWFYNIRHDQANMGYWYSRDAWAERAQRDVKSSTASRATYRALWWAFRAFGWEHVWGETPWRFAVAHGKRARAVVEAVIPEYAVINGRRRSVYVLRITRKAFLG